MLRAFGGILQMLQILDNLPGLGELVCTSCTVLRSLSLYLDLVLINAGLVRTGHPCLYESSDST